MNGTTNRKKSKSEKFPVMKSSDAYLDASCAFVNAKVSVGLSDVCNKSLSEGLCFFVNSKNGKEDRNSACEHHVL